MIALPASLNLCSIIQQMLCEWCSPSYLGAIAKSSMLNEAQMSLMHDWWQYPCHSTTQVATWAGLFVTVVIS